MDGLIYSGKYVESDPSQRHARCTVHPYEWKDAAFDPEREPKALEFIQRAHDFNIYNGLVVPIPGPNGCVGQVFMGGESFRIPMRDRPCLHLMGLYAFERVERLCGRHVCKPRLTTREMEVLTWTAAGKPSWEIGEILHISHRTIDFHHGSIMQKLGTHNKTHAVVIALRQKLIAL